MSMQRTRRRCGYVCVVVAAFAAAPQALAQPLGEWNLANPEESAWLDWSVHAVHLPMQPDGQVLVFSGQPPPDGTPAQLWDPIQEALEDAFYPEQLLCAGHAALSGGSVLVAGGQSASDRTLEFTGIWVERPDMAVGRFYPTLLTLPPSGKILALGGEGGLGVEFPEIYDPTIPGWTLMTNSGADQLLAQYPWAFVLPDGRVAVVGGYRGTPEPEVIKVLDLAAQEWTEPPMEEDQDVWWTGNEGSAVMYEPGKVLRCGGRNLQGVAVALAATIDFNEPLPWMWVPESSMTRERAEYNLVLLADGHIFAVGGFNNLDPPLGPYEVETEWIDIQDPFAVWEPLAPLLPISQGGSGGRAHHSTAVLLPDGRVFLGGESNNASGAIKRAEIFSPPYLFTGNPRPTISSYPGSVQWGQTFRIVLGNPPPVPAQQVAKVHLIRLASTTHGFDQNQRLVPLDFSVASGARLDVTIPTNKNEAPPGYYMLFVVSDAGVPSVGVYIMIIPTVAI